MRRGNGFLLSFCLGASALAADPPSPSPSPLPPAEPPTIASLVKPKSLQKAAESKDVVTSAVATPAKGQPGAYDYHCSVLMRVDAPLELTHRVLTDYKQYSENVPYIDKTEFNASTNTLLVEGGIWSFRLRSWVHFEPRSERWIPFRVTHGHFTGMAGQFVYEPVGKDRTLVYFEGDLKGLHVPTGLSFVIERGAEIVFALTARKMTSRIEGLKRPVSPLHPQPEASPEGKNERSNTDVPAPRSHL